MRASGERARARTLRITTCARLLALTLRFCPKRLPTAHFQAATGWGVRCAQARWEADGALAGEVLAKRACIAVSEDGDLLARLCPLVLRHGGTEVVELGDILKCADLNDNQVRAESGVGLWLRDCLFTGAAGTPQFQEVCALAGCDYADSPHGIAFATALKAYTRPDHGRSFEDVSERGGCRELWNCINSSHRFSRFWLPSRPS